MPRQSPRFKSTKRLSRHLRLGLFAACLSLSGFICTSQTPAPPAGETPYTLKVETNRVLVPVVVRDRQGRPITDLKRDDFQIFSNNQPQPIAGFTIQRWVAPPAATQPSIKANAQANTASETGPALKQNPATLPQRFLLFLFDDMHLSAEDLAHVQAASTKVLAESLTEKDIAAVISTSLKTNSGLTRDRARLHEAILSLTPRGIFRSDGAACPNIDYYMADQMENKHDSVALDAATQQVFSCSPGLNPQRDVEVAQRMAESAAQRVLTAGDQDVRGSFAAIGEIVRRMSTLPGQRTLILISPGFLAITPEQRLIESRVMDIAAEANVTISALDARGLYTTELGASERSPGSGRLAQLKTEYRHASSVESENPMAELADATGGTFFHNRNDLDAGLAHLTETPECVYMLELSLANIKQDGSYRRLKVKVARDGVQVQSRHGYFAPKAEKSRK